MALYRRESRKCKTCEYYFEKSYGRPTCQFEPPKVSGEHQDGSFPETSEELFCSKWEPIWHENPMIREAWNEFMLVHKLITSGEENEKT